VLDPRVKAGDVVKRGGAFDPRAFSSAFDVGAVTLSERPEVNLLATVNRALSFLRDYKPGT
jgi:hypothetical protein